jgi:hypothetical protein
MLLPKEVVKKITSSSRLWMKYDKNRKELMKRRQKGKETGQNCDETRKEAGQKWEKSRLLHTKNWYEKGQTKDRNRKTTGCKRDDENGKEMGCK